LRKLLQRTVETDGVRRVVGDRRFDGEDADQGEDDEPRRVARDARAATPALRGVAAAADPLVLELAREAAVQVPHADGDDDDAGDGDEPRAAPPRENDRGRLVRLPARRAAPARARDDLRGGV